MNASYILLAAWIVACTVLALWVAARYRRDRAERSEAARRDIPACLITLALRRARHDAAVKGWRTRRRRASRDVEILEQMDGTR